jgi:hypothetical protein
MTKFRNLFISGLKFARTSSKTKFFFIFGKNHRFSGVEFTGGKGDDFVIRGDKKE